jgi:hypothetical protein
MLQLTFFLSCFVYTERRIAASRYDLLCCWHRAPSAALTAAGAQDMDVLDATDSDGKPGQATRDAEAVAVRPLSHSTLPSHRSLAFLRQMRAPFAGQRRRAARPIARLPASDRLPSRTRRTRSAPAAASPGRRSSG